MPRGNSLTEYEKGQIKAYLETGLTVNQISIRLRRSCCVINNFIQLRDNYGKNNNKRGRKPLLNDRDKRFIIKEATLNKKSAVKIQKEFFQDLSRKTINNVLSNNKNVSYKKAIKRPPLSDEHIINRLNFALVHQTWREEWKNVIFTDEKRFNLDGPDGTSQYWHDLRKNPEILSKRQFGNIFHCYVYY